MYLLGCLNTYVTSTKENKNKKEHWILHQVTCTYAFKYFIKSKCGHVGNTYLLLYCKYLCRYLLIYFLWQKYMCLYFLVDNEVLQKNCTKYNNIISLYSTYSCKSWF